MMGSGVFGDVWGGPTGVFGLVWEGDVEVRPHIRYRPRAGVFRPRGAPMKSGSVLGYRPRHSEVPDSYRPSKTDLQ